MLEIVQVYSSKHSYCTIIKCDTNTYVKLLSASRIKVGWFICHVCEYFNNVRRCYKCCEYTHFGKDCKYDNNVCGVCAGDHEERECKSEDKKCINCMRMNEKFQTEYPTDHAVFDPVCLVYHKKMKVARERTRFKI